MLALAEQYLAFVETARSLRLELAADYLVMAAWLAYLKSRLLLPSGRKSDEPEARRARRRPGGTVASARADPRGCPGARGAAAGRARHDAARCARRSVARRWSAAVDGERLRSACRLREAAPAADRFDDDTDQAFRLVDHRGAPGALAHARQSRSSGWTSTNFLVEFCTTPAMRRTVRASAFSVTLEMVKEGRIAPAPGRDVRADMGARVPRPRRGSRAPDGRGHPALPPMSSSSPAMIRTRRP